MKTPLRILRAELELREGPPEWDEDEIEDRGHAMRACTNLFLANPPHATTLTALADTLRMKRTRLRWLFSDVDGLLGAILIQHLTFVLKTMEQAAQAKDGGRAARAAYAAATRSPGGDHTPSHALYLRHRLTLPPDQLALLAPLTADIAACAAGENGALALSLLDAAHLTPEEAEIALQSILSNRERPTKTPPGPAPNPKTAPPNAPRPVATQPTPTPLLNKPAQLSHRAALTASSVGTHQSNPAPTHLPHPTAIRPPGQTPPALSLLMR